MPKFYVELEFIGPTGFEIEAEDDVDAYFEALSVCIESAKSSRSWLVNVQQVNNEEEA